MAELHTVGIDLGKNVFHVHGIDQAGAELFRRKLSRPQFEAFLNDIPVCIVAMEACASSHHWGRLADDLGHDVRLIPVQHVKPFVLRHKNDAIDAAAIARAAQHPSTHFVTVKSENRQALSMLFRTRELLLSQRVQLTNALRGHFAECGVVLPETRDKVDRFLDLCWEVLEKLPRYVAHLARVYMRQIENLEVELGILKVRIKRLVTEHKVPQRLQTMPGVGPLAALAILAYTPPLEIFKSGRDFAAWLGLVPRQHSTGGKSRLGRITKMGQRDIRRLLIVGASAAVMRCEKFGKSDDPWLQRMMARKPRMVVVVAQANRMARQLWAMMTKEQDYEIRAVA